MMPGRCRPQSLPASPHSTPTADPPRGRPGSGVQRNRILRQLTADSRSPGRDSTPPRRTCPAIADHWPTSWPSRSGTIWILKNTAGAWSPVYQQGDPGNGIGGYDLKYAADRAFALDCSAYGRVDYLALYRPGTGTMWVLDKE